MDYSSLIQELEDTKAQLQKQKNLKEMYINKGKETTRELERLRNYSDGAVLNQAKIASQVRENTRQKKKKDLHKDYEELKVAHLVNEEKYQTDLTVEKDQNDLLRKELDRITVELQAEHHRNGLLNDKLVTASQVETLQHELQIEVQERKLLQHQLEELKMTVTESQDQFTARLQAEQQKNGLLHDKLVTVSQEYESQVISVTQQVENLHRELDKVVKAHADTAASDLQTITDLKAERDNLRQQMTEEINHQVETLQHELQNEAQQRELLQQQVEELEMAQTQSQEQFTAELREEQQQNDLLRDKLVTVSQEYDSQVISVTQQVENLHRELDVEVKTHADTVASDLQMITNLKAEQDDLRQQMTEEINRLLQDGQEKEELHERQLGGLLAQLVVQTSLNLELSRELKALKQAEVPEEEPRKQESIDTAAALEHLDVIEVSDETVPERPKKSNWKRFRHFVGLRKPQRWKK